MSENKLSKTRTISDFFDTDYKDFSQYVAENRALPGIDGFKTGARKIMHAAFNGSLKNGDQKKIPNLSGDTMNLSLYAHGDGSLNGTCITLSQEHRFNINPLYIDSQNGTLRDSSTASPRYLYVKLSKYAKLWKTDIELTEQIFDEGQYIEPKYYLPIIPMQIINRQEGMSPGFRFSSMSYNPVDVIDACIECLSSKKKENKLENILIRPYVRGIKSKNWKFEEEGWVNYGEFKWDEKKKMILITDLPYDIEYTDFEKMLNKMVENEDIKDWANYSEDGNIDYRIDCKKGKLSGVLKGKTINQKIQAKFKLRRVLPNDCLWVLDENKKVRHFNTNKELIEYFVNFRLSKYTDRKTRLVKILEDKFKSNSELVKFIELVCNGKLKIRNRSKVDIKVDMDKHSLSMHLLSTPMSKVTIEERDELLKQNEEIKKELEYIKKTTEKQMYLNDLNELRKELEKDFK